MDIDADTAHVKPLAAALYERLRAALTEFNAGMALDRMGDRAREGGDQPALAPAMVMLTIQDVMDEVYGTGGAAAAHALIETWMAEMADDGEGQSRH